MDERIKALRAKAKHLSPVLQIGKNGVQAGTVDLISRELDARQLIKVKMLPSALPENASKSDRRAIAQKIAEATHALVVEQVGNIIVLYRA